MKIEEITAPSDWALATGPFGSSIGSKTFRDSGVPLIRGSNLSSKIEVRIDDKGLVFVDEELAQKFKRSEARTGDLVFTCWGTINQVGLVDKRAKYDRYIVSNKQMKFTPDPERANPLFLYYWFSGPEGQRTILSGGIGSSVPGFNLGQLRNIRVPLPPLVEQTAIVALLGGLDDKIELNRQMNETLEGIARAIFRDWFVDFAPTRAKMDGREPYLAPHLWALFPDRLDDDGKPEGWERKRAEELFDISIGRTPPRKEKQHFKRAGEGCTWLSIKTMGNLQVFAFDSEEDLSPSAVAQFRVPIIPAGTVVVSFKLTVGRVAITADDMHSNEAIAHLKSNDMTPIASEYTYCFMREFDFSSLGSTSSIATAVNSKSIKGIQVLVPEPIVNDAFREIASVIFDRIKANSLDNRTLAATRDLLLPKLMSGEIRVAEAAELADEAVAGDGPQLEAGAPP